MKKIKLFTMLIFLISQSASAGFADEIAKSMFKKKVGQLYAKALSCTPLETDPKSSMDVTDWIKIQPGLPVWQMLAELEVTANEARKYANSIGGNDKKRHCLAGCYITKKFNYTSGVLVGWLKELSDASDCSKSTSFEKEDYEVTIVGAKLGEKDEQCDVLCKK